MADLSPADSLFLEQLTRLIEENMSSEQFGVTELAERTSMSRSNLLRKVKNITGLSVSQLIREVRLRKGMELLRNSTLNVTEVSYQVGFGSTSYFIKCFREYYGYPPGEVGEHKDEPVPEQVPMVAASRRWLVWVAAAVVVLTGVAVYYFGYYPGSTEREKSIAVLPFKNESNDSTNVYLINGLMESTLNNLQQINDLRVISRTSTEKYRHAARSIPEMARELDVRYFVEGSGQKIGNQIKLTVRLIDGASDRRLWSRQYTREVTDIFSLQQEIAQNIAEEIRVIITPEERKRIEKIPTANLEAYDLFMQARSLLYQRRDPDLRQAIVLFDKAIALDAEFASAYAYAAIAYYYLDIFRSEKKFTSEIDSYADKALLYDSKLPESLVAKAFAYIIKNEQPLAVPYLEKALEYNPNSSEVIATLADFYANNLPNTAKYLEYALMGARLDIGSYDSVTASFVYLRLGNALIQSGFVEESLHYIDRSLAYNAANPYAKYVRAFVVYAAHHDLNETKQLLLKEFNQDTSRFDILQDIGKVCYYMREYDSAYHYYKRFIRIRETRQLDVYRHENLTIGITLDKVGLHQKAKEYIESYKAYMDQDQSLYKNLGLSGYYTYTGDVPRALEHLRLFSKEDDYFYWIVLFGPDDPAGDALRDHPEFKKLTKEIERKFWNRHRIIRETLEEKGLI
jgi:TolB-like protein/AraC-like DNA-binding protein